LTDKYDLTVAVPWSLSHYIPLNGFHPIYRALIDERPESIKIFAWDNVALSQILKTKPDWPQKVMARSLESAHFLSRQLNSKLAKPYIAHFWPPNISLTAMLPGDIEFHHTAPFPTMTRPFVFHCESFAPVFFPFAHQGTGKFNAPKALRSLYRHIFKSPLCLGIMSHIPETLHDFSLFFKDSQIDAKLYQSRIGLSSQALPSRPLPPKAPLTEPRFLFVNSANPRIKSFVHRGGHVALRFWRTFLNAGHVGRLTMHCRRPPDKDLADLGLDINFIQAEEQKSIFWIEDFLENRELNALMEDSHFALLPGNALDSASIMLAMALGCVPIVTDTVGAAVYVKNNENGIVLQGVFKNYWTTDPETGILIDRYHQDPRFDSELAIQLTQGISSLLPAPQQYQLLRGNALKTIRQHFLGSTFSHEIWQKTSDLYLKKTCCKNDLENRFTELCEGIIKDNEFKRLFKSTTQPLLKINTGTGYVTKLGDAFIQHAHSAMRLHNWSVMAEYALPDASSLNFSRTIKDLDGSYLEKSDFAIPNYRENEILRTFSKLLKPYPKIHRWLAKNLDRSLQAYFRLIKHNGHHSNNPDIHLALEGLHGFNIIRAQSSYFGIPQDEGKFMLEKARSNGYRTCLTGQSLNEVRQKILQNVDITNIHKIQNKRNHHPKLILEGVNGFNVILYSDVYYAIPQSDGAFKFSRILSNGYSCVFSGQTLDELLNVIETNPN
jgi:hypothetical protein